MPVNDPLKSLDFIAVDRTATLLVGQGGHESSCCSYLSVLFIADFQ